MEQTIHPEALKIFRKKRGWSQRQLAEQCGCSTEQVSRWERGKTERVRNHSREGLTRALGVSWEELTRVPDDDDEVETLGQRPKVQLNVRVRPETRVALQLVCLRYRMDLATVVEFAPLLFLIIAENSLVQRQKNLNAIEANFEQVTQESQRAAPHMAPAFWPRLEFEEAMSEEQESIDLRDIFFAIEDSYDVADYDPFVTYLQTLAGDLPSGPVDEIGPSYFDYVSYTIAQDTLREATGLAGDDEYELGLLSLISNGYLDLREVLSKKQILTSKEYSKWLSEQHDTAKEAYRTDQKKALEPFFGKLTNVTADKEAG